MSEQLHFELSDNDERWMPEDEITPKAASYAECLKRLGLEKGLSQDERERLATIAFWAYRAGYQDGERNE